MKLISLLLATTAKWSFAGQCIPRLNLETRRRNRVISAANDAEEDTETLSIANALGDSGAVFAVAQKDSLFVPFGRYPHALGLQIFDKESATILQAAFNDCGPFPIYKGHPDVPNRADSDPAAPAIGWGQGVAVENDGVRFPVKWGEEGLISIANAEFRFYSPYWDLRKIAGGIQPVRMKSIGLTNNPRITVPPIANDTTDKAHPGWLLDMLKAGKLLKEEDAGDPERVKEAVFKAGSHLDQAREMHHHMSYASDLQKRLAAANDALAEAQTKLTAAQQAAIDLATAQAEVTRLTGELSAANDSVKVARRARIDQALSGLLVETKVSPAQRDAVRGELLAVANDGELTAKIAHYSALPAQLKTERMTPDLGKGKGKLMKGIANDSAKRDGERAALVAAEDAALKPSVKNAQTRYDMAWANARAKRPELF